MNKITLTIPSLSDYVGVARLTASGIANRMKFTHEDIEDIKIAVSEACTNSVQYAYGDSAGEITIDFTVSEDNLEIAIADQGKGFNVTEEVKGKEEDPEKIGLGLGIVFMKSLMDHVDYQVSEKGTTVILTKRVSS
jgi:serine/threonine-protein kinase RsbW